MTTHFMRLFLMFVISLFVSCSSPSTGNRASADTTQNHTFPLADSYIDSLLVDTPIVLKAGKDYITIATSPYDKLYFGDKFSPYKLEPYEIADLEQVIDSIINIQNRKGNFKNKTLIDFKYQLFSVKTAKQKYQTRILAICNDQAGRKKWNSSRLDIEDGGDCYFSIIYDLTEKKVITFQINGNG